MQSPFPGMNPYLEQPAFWSSFHSRFMVAIANAIEPQLSDRYYVDVETRTYQIEIRERYLEIREVGSDAVITVLELLSPKNKQAGEGRKAYEQKRRSVLGSLTHLIELDLLRGGRPMEIIGHPRSTPYHILISRSSQRPGAELYRVTLQQPLPNIWIPLQPGEPEAIAPLQDTCHQVFRDARYGSRIDYHQPIPPPNLAPTDQRWVEQLLPPLRSN